MKYTKENPLRVVTLCSGYDSQCLALERLKRNYPEFDYELIAWSEFDPETPKTPLEKQPAVVAHNALFPQWADRNECFRLMGVDDDDIDKMQSSGLSNSAQYKLAGNSIVVDVLYHIFRKLLVETQNEDTQPTLF